MNVLRASKPAGIILLFPALALLFRMEMVSAQNAPSVPAEKSEKRAIPDQETFGFDVILSEGGKIFARVTANHMVFYKEDGMYLLSGDVKTEIFNTEGRQTSVIHSDSAEVNRDGSRLAARKNVSAKSDSGIVMQTDVLYWSNISREIFTDTFVTIYSANDTLYGIGFVSNANLTNWKIKKPQGTTNRMLRLP